VEFAVPPLATLTLSLTRWSSEYGEPLPLDRKTRPAPRRFSGGRSYFSYGRIVYQGASAPFYGRWHLDRRNSFYYGVGPEGTDPDRPHRPDAPTKPKLFFLHRGATWQNRLTPQSLAAAPTSQQKKRPQGRFFFLIVLQKPVRHGLLLKILYFYLTLVSLAGLD
jgi:hypothetical protein